MTELRTALCQALTGLATVVNELDIKVEFGDAHPCGGKWEDDYESVRKTFNDLQAAWGQFDPNGYTTWCMGEEDRLIDESETFWEGYRDAMETTIRYLDGSQDWE